MTKSRKTGNTKARQQTAGLLRKMRGEMRVSRRREATGDMEREDVLFFCEIIIPHFRRELVNEACTK